MVLNTQKSLSELVENHWPLKLVKHTILEFTEDRATVLAAAMAYYTIFSIFPLLLGIISILGFILPSGNAQQMVFDELTGFLPGSADLIQQNIENVIRLRGTIGVFSLLSFLWGGSGLFSNLRRAANLAWDIAKTRNFFSGKMRDAIVMSITAILFLMSMAASTLFSLLDSQNNIGQYWLVTIGSRFIAFSLILGIFLMLYKYLPNIRTYWRFTWPGALLGALLFELLRFGFMIYLTNFASYQLVYGSLASVIILLFWIYLSAIIFILGIELNSELYRLWLGLRRGERL